MSDKPGLYERLLMLGRTLRAEFTLGGASLFTKFGIGLAEIAVPPQPVAKIVPGTVATQSLPVRPVRARKRSAGSREQRVMYLSWRINATVLVVRYDGVDVLDANGKLLRREPLSLRDCDLIEHVMNELHIADQISLARKEIAEIPCTADSEDVSAPAILLPDPHGIIEPTLLHDKPRANDRGDSTWLAVLSATNLSRPDKACLELAKALNRIAAETKGYNLRVKLVLDPEELAEHGV